MTTQGVKQRRIRPTVVHASSTQLSMELSPDLQQHMLFQSWAETVNHANMFHFTHLLTSILIYPLILKKIIQNCSLI